MLGEAKRILTIHHMTEEEASGGFSESCWYGMPARGPEVREGMNWGIGWLQYHELLSMTVAAGDIGPVCRTCACLASTTGGKHTCLATISKS